MKKVEETTGVEKVTAEELTALNEKINAMNKLQIQIGGLEAHKHDMLTALSTINTDMQGLQKELEAKYGSVNIDLATGEITYVSDNQEN
jgi:allophanate hydrolase subunit 1